MFVDYVTRGVKAGVVAGLVFGLFVALVLNPLVGYADAAGHDHGEDSAVSFAVTETVSAVSGVLWGVLLGGVVFGVGFYLLEPLLPGSGALRSYVLAGMGFLTASGAPWVALPPTPGVETALPTEIRLALYGGLMIIGALLSLLALAAYDRLRSRGRAVATAAAALSLTPLAVPAAFAPATTADAALPPSLSVGVTGAVVFGQLLLWLLLAATHARFHAAGPHADGAAASSPVAAD